MHWKLQCLHPALVNNKGPTLLLDNTQPHSTQPTLQKRNELGYNVLHHLPYSPDLLPNDYTSLSISTTFFREDASTTSRTQKMLSNSVQSLRHVWLFLNPWTATRQGSLSITNAQSLLKLMSIMSVMPSNHLILCCPLLLLPSVFPSIRVFSKESVLCIRWSKYWSFSFSISPSSEYSGIISFRADCWISLQSKELSRVFSNNTVQKHQFFGAQLPL